MIIEFITASFLIILLNNIGKEVISSIVKLNRISFQLLILICSCYLIILTLLKFFNISFEETILGAIINFIFYISGNLSVILLLLKMDNNEMKNPISKTLVVVFLILVLGSITIKTISYFTTQNGIGFFAKVEQKIIMNKDINGIRFEILREDRSSISSNFIEFKVISHSKFRLLKREVFTFTIKSFKDNHKVDIEFLNGSYFLTIEEDYRNYEENFKLLSDKIGI